MLAKERTRDVFEYNPAYPKPPLVPVPAAEDIDLLMREMNFKPSSLTRVLLRVMLRINGFHRYLRKLPDQLETVLRTSDVRGGALYAPVINATLALADDPEKLTVTDRAVSLILGARSLHADVSSGRLSADEFRGEPLEMGLYPNFFSTTQIVDGKLARIFKSDRYDLITVIINGRFFQFSLPDTDSLEGVTKLRNTLDEIIRTGSSNVSGEAARLSPGIITCANTPVQIRAFNMMAKDGDNRQALELIRHSFLILALDLQDSPDNLADAAKTAHSKNLHNRWFHHSLQLVVFANAKACAVCNFSTYLDGNTMMRGASEIQRRAVACNLAEIQVEKSAPCDLTELKWKVPPQMIRFAERDIDRILDQQDATLTISGIGRTTFENMKVDAVPTFISALQMAAHKLTGSHTLVTQFLTMSKYRCMSLVTPVVSTDAMVRFVDYMNQPGYNKQEAVNLLVKANAGQTEQSRLARKSLPFYDIYGFYLMSLKGMKRMTVTLFTLLYLYLMKKAGLFNPQRREILVSHPDISPAIPLVGRPGVRLPYVKYFGLHYQIFEERIVITYMPGVNWRVDNKTLNNEIEKALRQIMELA